jgi:Reverse transcriptase (RNA-dependent DNA polymerase)
MNQIFKPYLRQFVLVFFDDIFIYIIDLHTHKEHLSKVLQLLQDNQLYAKLSKCEFRVKKIEYLGHIISADGVATDPNKMKVMLDWP